jgi:hypothetical protein
MNSRTNSEKFHKRNNYFRNSITHSFIKIDSFADGYCSLNRLYACIKPISHTR